MECNYLAEFSEIKYFTSIFILLALQSLNPTGASTKSPRRPKFKATALQSLTPKERGNVAAASRTLPTHFCPGTDCSEFFECPSLPAKALITLIIKG